LAAKPLTTVPSAGLIASARWRSASVPDRNPLGLVEFALRWRTNRAKSAAASCSDASVTPSSVVTRLDMELSITRNLPSYATVETVWLQTSRPCRTVGGVCRFSMWVQ
jgi:hypothetical protein